jgi:predicted RNA polymerase sigma factor
MSEARSVWPSPVVALNRTVAVAQVSGPARALVEVEQLERDGRLAGYQYLPAVKADLLLRRLGLTDEASVAYRQALELTRNEPERKFLAERLANLDRP